MDVGTSPVFTWLIQADSSINPEQHHNHHIVIEQLLLSQRPCRGLIGPFFLVFYLFFFIVEKL